MLHSINIGSLLTSPLPYTGSVIARFLYRGNPLANWTAFEEGFGAWRLAYLTAAKFPEKAQHLKMSLLTN